MDNLITIIAAAIEVEAPADDKARQWVELLPGPEIKFRDKRETLTMADANKVIKACDLERGIPVDFDHQGEKIGGGTVPQAPAAGWIVAMAAKDGGIEALIEWTKLGREGVTDRQYRYISPTITYDDNTKNVIRITSAGLTNKPALTMKALAASEDGQPDDPKEDGKGKLASKPTAFWSELTDALGLSDSATKAEVMAQIATMMAAKGKTKNDADAVDREDDDSRKVTAAVDTIAAHIDTVNRERNSERVELAITQASRDGKLPPAMHGWARELCAAKPDLFDQFVSKITPVVQFGTLGIEGAPPRNGQNARSDAETALCSQLGVKPEDLR